LPRYDLPNAAPEPLRLVQRFVNTLDHEHGREWIGTPATLAEWLGAPVGEDPLDQVVAVALGAMLDGSWPPLKACPNCWWAFYDYSRNRSASWCSMQLCGNRLKTRAYRRRRARA